MSKRFSSEELFKLRNNISLETVIENLLGLPSKQVEGVYRFLCPKCEEFTAAVNPKTNLSRCFRCQQNFNTIELVMEERGLSFVEAVRTLKSMQAAPLQGRGRNNSGSPVQIRDILGSLCSSS